MVDPGAAQMLIKQLNRWYRKRAKPHGTTDYYHRGTRMTYTTVSRIVPCFFAGLMLAGGGLLFFVPNLMADKPPLEVLALKAGWVLMVTLGILAPLQVFRECAVVTDDGVLRFDLFGRETRMAWRDIFTYQIKPDDNKVVLRTNGKAKLTLSLSYDGWQDFLAMAARHLNPTLYWQLNFTIANIDAKRPVLRSTKKSRWAKWFSARQSPKA